tara:strand:+ start:146 stop:1096 length:951 start_codon:yes stop_codon:yes gene_type:complete
MAVFTKLIRNEIQKFVEMYDIGSLEEYYEIIEGIENTNFKIICDKKTYVLTIFEKRVKEEELPFFIDLKLYLNKNKFKCPRPIKNKNGKIINTIKNKKAIIITFIEGEKIDKPNEDQCNEVGKMLGNLHKLTINFNQKRKNSLDIEEWKKIFNKCENNNKEFDKIFFTLDKEINFLEKFWPKNLPSGIIHADLFRDNIFFDNNKINGIIDFYFSCNHFFLYDICIVINDWCFENNGKIFKNNFFSAIINGYNTFRKLNTNEIASLNIILRGAAVRILMTRIHDYIFHPHDAIVVKKDPYQYYNILKWHQNNVDLQL